MSLRLGMLLLAGAAHAEEVHLTQFLSDVGRTSPALKLQKAAVSQADAQVVLARVFPDPVVTAGLASFDVSRVGAQNNAAATVAVPIEWPGRRAARVVVAEASRQVALADFEDAARNVKATAAIAWVDAVYAQRITTQQEAALEILKQVLSLNEQRRREGAGSELAVLQARVEVTRLEGELLTARAQARGLRLALEALAGRTEVDGVVLPPLADELPPGPRTLDEEALAQAALERRDLVSRRRAVHAAHTQVELAKTMLIPDVTVGLGWLYYTPGGAGTAYQGPGYHTVNAMLSVPIPLGGRAGAEQQAAQAQVEAADAALNATELQVRTELHVAVLRYDAAQTRLERFNAGALADGDRLLEMAKTSYLEGASRLLELLSAQRSWIDLRLSAEAAKAEAARANIALEAAAGVSP